MTKYSLRKFIPVVEKLYIKEEPIDVNNELEKMFIEESKKVLEFIAKNPKILKYLPIANLAFSLKKIVK